MRNKIQIGCFLGLLLLGLSACSQKTDIYLEEYGTDSQNTEAKDMMQDAEALQEETQDKVFYVYICGAVVNPGVYTLPQGSRIYEVIQAAGGLCDEAEDTLVNQAEPVSDGMMIRIYTKEEAELQKEMSADNMQSDGKLDINAAGVTELMTLPGIGSAKAEAIVSYRTENGNFSNIEELMDIPGIKEGIFAQIREHIKVNISN